MTDKIKCWCGAVGTYEELFDDSGLPDGCGGTGVVQCECGGDMCVDLDDLGVQDGSQMSTNTTRDWRYDLAGP